MVRSLVCSLARVPETRFSFFSVVPGSHRPDQRTCTRGGCRGVPRSICLSPGSSPGEKEGWKLD
jgi:hypothetical protein